MFPYRRHGGKKRPKGGGPPPRKGRGPQRPLPNSARDLLPLLQPATKALAQMLAGRTRASGQLDQARTLLAHAERLIAERGHNRLNPAEREEFFEQLARLRLTLADADAEAEAAAQESQPDRPAPPPVEKERLREMALALATKGGGSFRPAWPEEGREGPAAPSSAAPTGVARPESSAGPDRRVGVPPGLAGERRADGDDDQPTDEGTAAAEGGPTAAERSPDADRPRRPFTRGERLVLGRRAAAPPSPVAEDGPPDDDLPAPRTRVAVRPTTRRRAPPMESAGQPEGAVDNGTAAVETPTGASAADGDDSGTKPASTRSRRRARKTEQGLPEGWIVDDEGFVVPGPG